MLTPLLHTHKCVLRNTHVNECGDLHYHRPDNETEGNSRYSANLTVLIWNGSFNTEHIFVLTLK